VRPEEDSLSQEPVAAGPGPQASGPLTFRYPDPLVASLRPEFDRLRLFNAGVERLASGMRWAEGPVWFGDLRCLLWSDIPNDRILRWDEETGTISPFRRPSGFANGNTRDRQGRLVTCEHGNRRVTRTEIDGSITVLADRFEGRRLNSPNDVVVRSDGSIWFTDPPFGILSHYEGDRAESELPAAVWRIDPHDLTLSMVTDSLVGPNGLCFSPDERLLYIVDSRSQPRSIHVFEVAPDGRSVSSGKELIRAEQGGLPDGFRCDVEGNLWCGWGGGEGLDGVMVFDPGGQPIGHVTLPERCANLCFGGLRRNRLFMASSRSLYSLYVATQGAMGG